MKEQGVPDNHLRDPRGARPRLRRSLITLSVLLATPPAWAVVSCSNPDNICTGDPCVIRSIQVETPCTVNFGARTVNVRGLLRVPGGGTLQFTAGAIDVGNSASINGANSTGDGGSVSLTTTGDISIEGRLKVSGKQNGGSVTLQAGGALNTTGGIRATAGGLGGQAMLSGNTGVSVGQAVDTRGRIFGGSIQVSSASGITLDHELRVGTGTGTIFGGNVSVQAGGDVAVHRRIVADGKMDGGSIVVSSTSGGVALDQDLRARGHHGAGHSIEVDAAGVLTTGHKIDAHGVTGGGTICVKAASGDVSGTYLADGGERRHPCSSNRGRPHTRR